MSATSGTTDLLIEILNEGKIDEDLIPTYIERIVERHNELSPNDLWKNNEFLAQIERLRRVLYGVSYTEELSKSLKDLILSFGERLVVFIIRDILQETLPDRSVHIVYPEDFLLTDGNPSQARIDLKSSEELMIPLLEGIPHRSVLIVPGFYGKSKEGKVTLFGRSGTDYTASAVAHILGTTSLTIWKDVAGFMTADPKIVKQAMKLETLSYSEAAELSHFGAKILHYRAVLPARLSGIQVVIRSIYNPEDVSVIKESSDLSGSVKSISYIDNLAIIKLFNTRGGDQRGVFHRYAKLIEDEGVNIISIATSQTCIAFLVQMDELRNSTIVERSGEFTDSVVVEKGHALIACVGDALSRTKGIAMRTFSALARKGINIDLISAGASESALHFTVASSSLVQAVQAIHNELIDV